MFAPNPEVPDPGDFSVSILDPDKVFDLPAFAEAGDLLVTIQRFGAVDDIPPNAEAMLWFCAVSGRSETSPAIWKQVLLGPGVEGKNMGKG